MDIWRKENPKQCGYYLAKWKVKINDERTKRVSEMWFDGRNWWSKREYIDGDCYSVFDPLGRCMTDNVLFWTEKPK
jgi:hypothetical protein